VTTWHYDNARTGANTAETQLMPSNVNKNSFGKLFEQPVDGAIVGQALYLPKLRIPNKGVHNTVFVATMHDSVYAFDADSNVGADANPLWHRSFLSAGVNTVPIKMQGCGATTGWSEVGILSTMAIDPVARTLYVVAKTYENGTLVHRLHALDAKTGLDKKGSPVVIQGSFAAAGKTQTFQNSVQVNRPALLFESGNVYIGFGSNGCRTTAQGWVIAYNGKTLAPMGAFADEIGIGGAGIWQKGGGLSSDSDGKIYAETADGPFKSGVGFGQSVFKLSQVGSKLQLADWFSPFNQYYIDHNDLDMNDPVLILPDQPGPNRHLALAVGKQGTIYVLNRDDMGHYCGTCTITDTQIVQELTKQAGFETGGLVYWNDNIYATPVASSSMVFGMNAGLLDSTPVARSVTLASGHSPVLTANGNSNGILWQLSGSNLVAFDALSLKRLYTSVQATNGRDKLPKLPHFGNLVVANGKVYVGTNNSLAFFGLL
jgi:hypothetical protein